MEATAELTYAKSALKSGEVKDMLQKLPGLLMETTEKTLIKQEGALLNEQHKLKEMRNVSRSRGRDASLNNTSALSSVRVTAPSARHSSRLNSGQKPLRQQIDDIDSQLFREDDSDENRSDGNMTFDMGASQLNLTSKRESMANTSILIKNQQS